MSIDDKIYSGKEFNELIKGKRLVKLTSENEHWLRNECSYKCGNLCRIATQPDSILMIPTTIPIFGHIINMKCVFMISIILDNISN